jgi:hypothetical protein
MTMNDLNPFEKEIKRTYRLPAANQAFFNQLEASLQAHQPNLAEKSKPAFPISRGWSYALATFLLIGVMILALGPSKVLAQIQAVFGVVPDVGLVDTSTPFRQLAAPVSDTRDGVTLTIQSAFLSADQTVITYTMSDLPADIQRAGFGDPECSMPAYLTLPDGSSLEAAGSSGSLAPDGSFIRDVRFSGAFPTNINQATLVFPCLEGTARDKGPEYWPFSLAFRPVSEDIVVYPATLLPPQAGNENARQATAQPNPQGEATTASAAMPQAILDGERMEGMDVLGVVEQPDAYWVTWAYPDRGDNDIQINGQLYIAPFNPVVYDATGAELPAPDHETQLELWKYEEGVRNQLSGEDQLKYTGTMHTFVVPKTGVTFPVYAKQNVYERTFPEKEAFADVEFNAANVQSSGEPITIDQEIRLGAVKFTLDSIEQNPYGGYSFRFDGTEGKVVQCLVSLVGYTTNMGGGSSFNPDDPFHFSQAEIFQQNPTGQLTVRVSQPAVLGDLISFIGIWSPAK